jgi:pimeloyl-ACP methyl ester carboxylesterase
MYPEPHRGPQVKVALAAGCPGGTASATLDLWGINENAAMVQAKTTTPRKVHRRHVTGPQCRDPGPWVGGRSSVLRRWGPVSVRKPLIVAAGLTGLAVAGRVVLHHAATTMQARTDVELDPLFDVPADVAHHYVDSVDGGTIHIIERGVGRPLLLIHGIALQAGVWAPQLNQMADRYRVLAMDVRGHGLSTAGGDGFGRRMAAHDVKSVLDHFDLRGTIAVGHSMGGMILMEFVRDFAADLEQRIAGLVFMSTAAYGILPRPALPLARALGRRAQARTVAGKRVPELRLSGNDDLGWILARLAFGARPPAKAVNQVRHFLEEVPQSTSLPSGIDLLYHDARQFLASTRTHSMVMVGSRDLLAPVYVARRIARLLPSARLEVLRGAGHQLMEERPFAVASLIDDFVAGLPGQGPPGSTV